MRRTFAFMLLCALATAPAFAAEQHDDFGIKDIMKPEPGTKPAKVRPLDIPDKSPAPKKRTHKAARGSSNTVYPAKLPPPLHYVPRQSRSVERHPPVLPPPIVSPQTGIAYPNVSGVPGSGPGGRETYQDRAVRCAHQAGMYGQQGTGYVGTCINQ